MSHKDSLGSREGLGLRRGLSWEVQKRFLVCDIILRKGNCFCCGTNEINTARTVSLSL